MDPKRKLKGMLARIFSDAVVSDEERAELRAHLAPGALLMPRDVEEVLADFIATTWKITIADKVISDVERQRLRAIVEELELPAELLPAEWRKLLDTPD
jgi:hypothetical protein